MPRFRRTFGSAFSPVAGSAGPPAQGPQRGSPPIALIAARSAEEGRAP